MLNGHSPESARPLLTQSDASLLGAVVERGRAVSLQELIHDYDWLLRMILTYDEISYGIPRLVAAGLARVEGSRFCATPAALAIRRSVKAHVLGDVSTGMERVLDQMGMLGKTEDRALGRLQGFDEAQLEAAIKAHGRWFSFWSWPIMSLSEWLARFRGPRRRNRQ